MVKTVEGRFTVCVWRDMVLVFERLPGDWIRASGGEERVRYLCHSMTEVIRKYRKEQKKLDEQKRAMAREAWRAAHNG